jgi:hypothetical protein
MLSEYNFSGNLMSSSLGCQITIMTDFILDVTTLSSSMGQIANKSNNQTVATFWSRLNQEKITL